MKCLVWLFFYIPADFDLLCCEHAAHSVSDRNSFLQNRSFLAIKKLDKNQWSQFLHIFLFYKYQFLFRSVWPKSIEKLEPNFARIIFRGSAITSNKFIRDQLHFRLKFSDSLITKIMEATVSAEAIGTKAITLPCDWPSVTTKIDKFRENDKCTTILHGVSVRNRVQCCFSHSQIQLRGDLDAFF